MKNRIKPVKRSAAAAGIRIVDWMKSEPFWSIAIKMAIGIMTNGLSFASHATVIAVNPTPPAVVAVNV